MKKYNTKGTPKQDLIAERAQLKVFRRDVALLKRKGLLDKKYDARSVSPTKYLKSQIKKFSDVLTGTATPVKVNRKKATYYKEQGYILKNGRVVVPHLPNEKVYGSHGNFAVKVTTPSGSITRTDRGISAKSLPEWEEEIRHEFKRLKPNEQLSFQIGDNFTKGKFDTAEMMIMFLYNYKGYEEEAEREYLADNGFVSGLVVYKIDRNANMPRNIRSPEQIAHKKEKQRERYHNYIDNMTPARQTEYRKDRAEAAEKQRARMTPEQKEAAKIKARERAKKSYIARAGKSNGKKGSGND